MSNKLVTSAWIPSMISMVILLIPAAVAAEAADEAWSVPRTVDGHPDFQGVWANNNATPLQRPPEWQGKERLSAEEVARLEEAARRANNAGEDALFGDQLVLAAIADEKAESYDPTTGNYNGFWVVDRDFSERTSLVVDPPSGLIPPFTEQAKDRLCKQTKHFSEHPADTWADRPLSERCITYSVPTIHAGYNSYFQIFQNKDHVVIQMELIHDARVIPLDGGAHVDDDIRLWHGDARGHWEGDTLVVETKNFSPQSDFLGSKEGLQLTERFTRVGPDTLQWDVTVNDPETWTGPWTASIPLKRSDDPIFEYACHEGNYGMQGILAGHRTQEAEGKESPPDPAGFGLPIECEDTAASSG